MAAPTALTVRSITSSAPLVDTAKTAGTLTDGNTFPNGPTTYLEATSTVGGTITVTTPGTVAGNAIADKVITMTGAQTIKIGPFDPTVYGSDVVLVVSAVSITLAVYALTG